MRLTVIVPATNRPPTLPGCIEAIRAADDPPEDLIVVDLPAGAGPAEARNLGAAKATGDVLVFVDADVVVHRDAFTRLRAAFEAEPGLDAVFGSYDDDPTATGVVSSFRNLLHHHVHQEAAGPAATFWAGLGAVRRDAFLDASGFDAARYPHPSIEDVELGTRMSAAGARLLLDPRVQGTHLKEWRLGDMLRTDLARRGVPWVRLLLERKAAAGVLNLGWRHRLSALACLAGAGGLLLGRPRAAGGAAVALVLLNHRLYALLWRRRGPGAALAGVGLHAAHHLAGAASVPVAAALHLSRGRGGVPGRAPTGRG